MSAPATEPVREPTGAIRPDDLDAWVDDVARSAARVADAYEVRGDLKTNRKCSVDGGRPNSWSTSRVGGFCVKLHVGGGTGFASSHDPTAASVSRLVERALALARANAARGGRDFPFTPGSGRRTAYAPDVRAHPRGASLDDHLALLARAVDGATAVDPAARVAAALGSLDRRVVVADAAGTWLDHDSLVSTLFVHVVHKGARLADGQAWESGERGLGDFEDNGGPERLGREAAEHAEEASRAERAPAGRMRVLCDNHLTGLLAHESFGHLAEFDLVSMGWSILRGRKGQRFADERVSIVDAPEVPGSPRTGVRVPYDEEGTPGEAVRILDHGVLRRFMHVRGSAGEDADAPTGNGRALSARHPPIVRMRNTFIEPGDLTVDEALDALGDGVYLVGGRGGAPASDGSFMFTATRGYRVKGGRIEAPIRSTSISGNVLDFLRGVEGITRDFGVFSTYFGGCGKWDQSFLHVGMGGPHVLVSGALVGGEVV